MRLLAFAVILFAVISCAPKSDKVDNSTDSLTVDDASAESTATPVSSEQASNTEATPEHEPTFGDSYYEPDLFIGSDLDATIDLLKKRLKIADKDISIYAYMGDYDSIKTVSFPGSSLSFYGTTDGTFYLDDAEIKTPGFPFKNGLVIGMPRKEAVAIMGIDSTAIEHWGNEERYMHDFIMGSGDHQLYTFTFNETSFIGLTRKQMDMD